MLLDVREAHEKEIKDIISKISIGEKSYAIPKVDLLYEELVTGCFNKDMFSRSVWIICMC